MPRVCHFACKSYKRQTIGVILAMSCSSTKKRGLKKVEEAATVAQFTVSLKVDIPASADINETEVAVQTAGRHAMAQAVQEAVRVAGEESKACPQCGSELR